jgi:hypothetical protein
MPEMYHEQDAAKRTQARFNAQIATMRLTDIVRGSGDTSFFNTGYTALGLVLFGLLSMIPRPRH